MGADDQIRRRFEEHRRELPRFRSRKERALEGHVARSDAEAAAHRGRSPRRRSSVTREEGRANPRNERREKSPSPCPPRSPHSPRPPRSPRSPRSPRPKVSRSRSRDRRTRRHRSPARRSIRQRSPHRPASRHQSPVAHSSRPSKRQRLHSPRRGGRSPGRSRQRLQSRPQSPVRSNASGRRGGYGRGGAAPRAPSAMERVLQRLDGVEEAIHRTKAESSSRPARPPAPAVPLAALLPHDPEGSLVRPGRPLPPGAGFVGAGGGDPWAPFVPPRPAPPPRDLAVSSRRARATAMAPLMKEVPTATLAHLWSLAESLQSLEQILLDSHGSMSLTPPSTFSELPRARCHAAASTLFAYVTPLQVAPSPGVVSATLLAERALDLKTIVGDRGTPVDVVGATASVVRLMWLAARKTLGELEADRM
ncbi:unnamed protein product [Closterium sp. Yama58-4]|nr:unnamed protein product [Closterium sp. Yama58-4]